MKKLSFFQKFCIVGFIAAVIVGLANLSVVLLGVPSYYDGSIKKFIVCTVFGLFYVVLFIKERNKERIQ